MITKCETLKIHIKFEFELYLEVYLANWLVQ